jgi:hypothetical protein
MPVNRLTPRLPDHTVNAVILFKNLAHLQGNPGKEDVGSQEGSDPNRALEIPNDCKENVSVKKLVSLFVAFAFVAGMVGLTAAQTTTTEKKAEKADKMEKSGGDKMDKKAGKKPAAKSASGTVKSASGDSIVVAGKDKGKDAEWTFAVDPKTKIKKGGKDAAAGDLMAGDSVQVRYSEQDGKMVAQSVSVRAAKSAKAAKGEPKAAGEKKEEKK